MKRVCPVRIAGTGSHPPAKVLTNYDLSKIVDTSDEWIVQRTGIRERRIVAEHEYPSDLGTHAARKALEDAGVAPEEVEVILCATSFPDKLFPGTGCMIQKNLGCRRAGAVDLNAACTGFVYAINSGWGYVAGGRYRNVLVVGTECLSRMTNWKDRSTCILFGDGAGAMLLQPCEGESDFLAGDLGADGTQGELIQMPGGGARHPGSTPNADPAAYTIQMRGREVYRFAVQKFVELSRGTARKAGLSMKDVDLLVPHQVNLRIIESACDRMGFPMEKVYINIHRYGNTSSASIPTAFDEAKREGRIRRGDIVLMVAFGGGLTWGSLVLRY